MLLVLLQNAWSSWYTRIGRPGEEIHRLKDRVWHRESWLAATWASPTGAKLARILVGIPDELIRLDDTTLEIADKPAGIKPPDLDHVRGVLADRQIAAVLACGKQAGATIDKVWKGPLVKIPHPAVRVLTYNTLMKYNTAVKTMLDLGRDEAKVVRVALDTYGVLSELPPVKDTLGDRSWILASFDQQAEGLAGGAAGGHPGVLPAAPTA